MVRQTKVRTREPQSLDPTRAVELLVRPKVQSHLQSYSAEDLQEAVDRDADAGIAKAVGLDGLTLQALRFKLDDSHRSLLRSVLRWVAGRVPEWLEGERAEVLGSSEGREWLRRNLEGIV